MVEYFNLFEGVIASKRRNTNNLFRKFEHKQNKSQFEVCQRYDDDDFKEVRILYLLEDN